MPEKYGGGLVYREWQKERLSDQRFYRKIPAEKWESFTSRLRPLEDHCSSLIWERLFAGVIHPFHYERARGWMGKLFKTVRSAPDYRGLTAEAALKKAFPETDVGMAFLIDDFICRSVYAAEPCALFDFWKRGWLLNNDTFILCAEHTQNVALWWEGTGPYLGKRGDRRLI